MPKASFSGFEWDEGNRLKCQKHGVSIDQIEHVLSHAETLIRPAPENPGEEARLLAIGRTHVGRYAFAVFTPRKRGGVIRLRPISARYMHKKEIRKYEEEIARAQKRQGGGESS